VNDGTWTWAVMERRRSPGVVHVNSACAMANAG